jgi:signal transduction histidine kinase
MARDHVRRSDPIPRFATPGTALAVLAVTAAAVVRTLAPPGPPLADQAVTAVVALAVVHAALGTVGLYVAERRATRAQLHVQFVVAVAVAVAAMIASRGHAFVLVLSLVSQGVLYLRTAGVVAVTGACLAATLGAYVANGRLGSDAIGAVAAVAFVVAFSHMLVRQRRARTEVERLAGELREANAQLRDHAADIEELATTQERNRIAREIHDGLGHYLTVVHVQLEAAQATLGHDPDQARRSVARAQALTREGLDEVRRSVAVLRGSTRSAIPAESLVRAIEKLAGDCTADGLAARVEVSGARRPLPDAVVFTLYRAAQEGVTNVRRHARASSVTIELAFSEADQVRLRIADDGVGGNAAPAGFGLVGLRERAALCGGTMSVSAARGRGFTLELELPT